MYFNFVFGTMQSMTYTLLSLAYFCPGVSSAFFSGRRARLVLSGPQVFQRLPQREAVGGRPGLFDPVDTQNLQRLSTVHRFPQTTSLSQGHQALPGSFQVSELHSKMLKTSVVIPLGARML